FPTRRSSDLRISSGLLALEVGGCRDPADVAVDALRVHVVTPGDVVGDLVFRVGHDLKLARRSSPSSRLDECAWALSHPTLDSSTVTRVSLFVLSVASGLLLIGCRDRRLPEGDARGGDLAAGRRIFERKCARCHSPRGDGKTVVAGRF